MTQVSLTVPRDDEVALVAAGTFFLTLAGKVPALELDDAPAPLDSVESAHLVRESEQPGDTPPKNELPDEFLKLDESGEWVDPTAEPTEEGIEVAGTIVDLDANGLPWDARIHSGGKTKVKAGTWRYKTGLDRDIIATVEAELKAMVSHAAPPPPAQETTAPPPPAQETTAPPPPAQETTAPPPPAQETTAPPPPAQETTAPPPPAQETTAPPPPAAEGMTVPAFLQLVTSNIVANKWTREDVERAIANQGIPGVEKIPHLMAHKDLIPKVLEELNA